MQITKTLITVLVTAGLLVTPRPATAADQTFSGVHYLVSTGKKAKQVKARLVLKDDAVEIHGERGATLLKDIRYTDIKSATYSMSKHPRYKATAVAAAAFGLLAVPFLLTKGKKHWLTFQADGDHLALRLSKKNFAMIIAAVEGQTGLTVERITE